MRTYRLVWLLVFDSLVVTGLLVALAVSPAALGGVAVAATIVGGVVASGVWCVSDPEPGRSCGRFVLRGAAFTTMTAAAALGLGAALGGSFFIVALCAALSGPPLVARYHRWLDSAPRPSAEEFLGAMAAAAWAHPGFVPGAPGAPVVPSEPSAPAGSAGKLRLLTDQELCQRWCASCVELSAPTSTSARNDAVEERRQLLDEIERRNPAGYWAWVTSDAPRPGTLRKHLSDTSDSHHRVDWDALLS